LGAYQEEETGTRSLVFCCKKLKKEPKERKPHKAKRFK